jgi:hypothetical protein
VLYRRHTVARVARTRPLPGERGSKLEI